MSGSDRIDLKSDVRRFLVGGGINTIFTVVLYQFLLIVTNASVSYAISWTAGFIFLICYYPTKVFKSSDNSKGGKFACGLIYLVVFLTSLLLVSGLEGGGLNPSLIIFVVLVYSSVVNFALMRAYFRRREN